MVHGTLGDAEFGRLLELRDGLRRFQRWSNEQAGDVGLTPTQHQLLLAIRGHGSPPSIREVSDHLLLRHHSVVELVDRAVGAGLVDRTGDDDDQRIVRLRLTRLGAEKVEALTHTHLEELARLRPRFESLWRDLPTR
jgi:DNA-binding MarR family transcriptional regulator